ncbi:MAG: potassium channel family protein [Clostridium sp.]|uniref:potassium channel family protein n=1 Tax=Clostridium sp. TaxID=1506 RepID=UPI003F383026
MGRLLLAVTTFVAIVAIFTNKENNNKIIRTIIETVREINVAYLKIFKGKAKFTKLIQGMIFIIAELMTAIAISGSVIKIIKNSTISMKDLAIVLAIIGIIISVYFIIGYVLLTLTSIHLFINKLDNKKLKNNLLISYFLISTYFFVFIISPKQFGQANVIVFIGLAFAYYLNMSVLIKLIKNPLAVKGSIIRERDGKVRNMRVIASILLLMMIIVNLFLAVSVINYSMPGSFSNNPSSFDLLYYTVITFTTVGYGDIVPLTVYGKVITILISITSVICLTVFLSSILSAKDEEE